VAVATDIMPGYDGRLAFTDIVGDRPENRDFVVDYGLQYVPTSLFFDAQGVLVDTHIGPLDEGEMRVRVEALLVGEQ
jgi:hypothetical protein